ncbi:hypothetical protein CYMTET_53508 [Cymbomonas tetramitiformis]|uniref:Phosphoglycerate mutase n=1 Tax=Cymbomonas tetramitiformis TaxID=36881 RepID=A0AAE0EPZ8_9CHLO|nr:hypothetical protein CYMTET_53508 [Cymbomonas tetramitiformis]
MSFDEQMSQAGITRIAFIRHANAAPLLPDGSKMKPKGEYGTPHDWKTDDQMRCLTEKGKAQAETARRWFIEGIGLHSNKVLVSSGARRAAETLQIMAEKRSQDDASVSIDLIWSLHPAGIAPKCEELFDMLNYGPLTRYYAEEGGEAALAEYGNIVLKEFQGLIASVADKPGDTISMFGHAVFLNAAAMQFLKMWGFSSTQAKDLTEINLGEAEGIILEKNNGVCSLKHIHCKMLAPEGVGVHPHFG